MAIVVNNADRVTTHTGLYRFGQLWFSVSMEQVFNAGCDEYWDEPSAMDIECSLPYEHLGRWLSLRTR